MKTIKSIDIFNQVDLNWNDKDVYECEFIFKSDFDKFKKLIINRLNKLEIKYHFYAYHSDVLDLIEFIESDEKCN